MPPAGSLIVPDDYPTIQAAIDNANAGDTVFVRKGTYIVNGTFHVPSSIYSIIIIDKQLSLIGEDSQETIIYGINPGYSPVDQNVIQVKADNVTISGFTITSGGHMVGIDVEDTNSHLPLRSKIVGNNIVNNFVGINRHGDYNHVTGVVQRSYDIISDNNITGNDEGIIVESSDSVISGNVVAENGGNGINVGYSVNVTIRGNTISHNNHMYKRSGAGGLLLSWWGPYYVYGNNITDNYGGGIGISSYCNNSTISYNNIENNNIGVHLSLVPKDCIGSGNKVYENNLINNLEQVVLDHNGTVFWDNGARGNYWSDYQSKYPRAIEVNASGIGNLPYVIGENNTDYYPLMRQVDISLAKPPVIPLPTTSPTTTTSTAPADESSLLIVGIIVLTVILAGLIVLIYRTHRRGNSVGKSHGNFSDGDHYSTKPASLVDLT